MAFDGLGKVVLGATAFSRVADLAATAARAGSPPPLRRSGRAAAAATSLTFFAPVGATPRPGPSDRSSSPAAVASGPPPRPWPPRGGRLRPRRLLRPRGGRGPAPPDRGPRASPSASSACPVTGPGGHRGGLGPRSGSTTTAGSLSDGDGAGAAFATGAEGALRPARPRASPSASTACPDWRASGRSPPARPGAGTDSDASMGVGSGAFRRGRYRHPVSPSGLAGPARRAAAKISFTLGR